jgi:hypothetical protein
MKIRCEDHHCGWHGDQSEAHEFLIIDRRFGPLNIVFCPKCHELNSTLVNVCEEPDCWEPATMGTPYPGGYKQHCHRHPPGKMKLYEFESLL